MKKIAKLPSQINTIKLVTRGEKTTENNPRRITPTRVIFLVIYYAVIVQVAIPALLINAVAYLDRIVRLGVKPSGYGCNTAGT